MHWSWLWRWVVLLARKATVHRLTLSHHFYKPDGQSQKANNAGRKPPV
jgi:hypothetical protein